MRQNLKQHGAWHFGVNITKENKVKNVLSFILIAVIILTAAADTVWAWKGHKDITELALQNMSASFFNKGSIANDAPTPDSWGEIHTASTCKSKADSYFDTWTSSTQAGYGSHYLEDAGQPYHAANEVTGTLFGYHDAFEDYAKDLILNDTEIRNAIINATKISLPTSGNVNSDHIQNLINAASPECSGINNLVKKGIANLTAAEKTDLKAKTKTALTRTSGYLKGALAQVFSIGDVNQDGQVTIVDALYISQFTVNSRSLSALQLLAADVNRDGQVTIVDALYIAQYTVGNRTFSW